MSDDPRMTPSREELMRRLASEKPSGLVRELWALVRHNRSWWLIPAVSVLLAAALLLLLAAGGAAPFLYTLF